MNKIISFISVAVLILAMTFSCKNNADEKQAADTKSADCANPDAVNPNGSSELALLMREMTTYTQSLGETIRKDSLIPFPVHFKAIHTAIPTDSTVKGDIFTGHADLYLNALDILYKGEKQERIENYNNLITSCISCHENFCRGPIKRITKMRIS